MKKGEHISFEERRRLGRCFADLREQGVPVKDIAARFSVTSVTVRRCMMAVDNVSEAVKVPPAEVRQPHPLGDLFVAMLHQIRDEIKAADRLAIARERLR